VAIRQIKKRYKMLRTRLALITIAPLILAVLMNCQSSAISQNSSNNNKAAANSESALSEDQKIQKEIIDIVAKHLGIEQESVDINIPLSKQKAPADELDVVEIIMTIEEKLGVEIKDEEIGVTVQGATTGLTVKKLVEVVSKKR
jgi:acyl carrier protein